MDSPEPRPPTPALIPDFFIAGAPKCGTTALFEYLRTHPGIAASSQKEPAYWSPDVRWRGQRTDPEAYARLWEGALPTALRGEGSTQYLRSAVAIPSILRVRPGARFIVLLRNPAEMAQAFHSQMIRMFEEDVGSLEAAWRLQAPRRQGERIPAGCTHAPKLQYAEVCALGDQLERFVGWVPPENRLVMLYDDLVGDTRAVYLRALSFLGLPDDGRRSFERVNENVRFRSVRLRSVHRRIPTLLGRLYAPLRAVATRAGISPSGVLARLNRDVAPRPPLRPAFEDELLAAFLPQVEKLETLLERDLSHWKVRRPNRGAAP